MLFLAKDPLVDNFDLSSVEEVLCAAAPMGDGLEDALSRRLPKVKEINQGILQIGNYKMLYLNEKLPCQERGTRKKCLRTSRTGLK